MEFHELANIFPLLDGEEFESLVRDVKEKGLVLPIWTYEGKILDGRNRYRACIKAGVEPQYQRYVGDDPIGFVWSTNKERRHLNSSQLAFSALRLEEFYAQEARKQQGTRTDLLLEKVKGFSPIHSAEQAAKIAGVSRDYVVQAKKLREENPDVAAQVMAGTTTLTEATRSIKHDTREARREENRALVAQAPTIQEALAQAKFATIVVDPPWDVAEIGDVEPFGRAVPTYAKMTMEQLLALPVGEYADVDCHLYLWAINRMLPQAFELLEEWGFRYITTITWGKPSFGMGNYYRGQTEHVLFGVKGNQPLKRKDVGTLLLAPRGPNGHSSKPLEFYDLVESCSYGPYLELFSRSKRPDWTAWGAEILMEIPA